ncbi:hypothetical protein [Nostoc sp.]
MPLVEFLASPQSRWVNGQTIFINGGYVGVLFWLTLVI